MHSPIDRLNFYCLSIHFWPKSVNVTFSQKGTKTPHQNNNLQNSNILCIVHLQINEGTYIFSEKKKLYFIHDFFDILQIFRCEFWRNFCSLSQKKSPAKNVHEIEAFLQYWALDHFSISIKVYIFLRYVSN